VLLKRCLGCVDQGATMTMGGEPLLLTNALGLAVAGIVSCTFTHPLDTTKARVQAPGSIYTGTVDVLCQSFRNEGVRGLYRGFGTVILGGTPGTIIYLCTYDFTKRRLLN
jgi:Mitochondrial carrier protein